MVEIIVGDEKLTLALPENPDYYVKPLEFPWNHVTGANVDSGGVAREWHARLLFFASKIPNVIRPGVYYEDGSNVFWGIDDPERVITISLENEPYKKLFIEVEDPSLAVATIKAVLNGEEKTREGFGADGAGNNTGNLHSEESEAAED